MSAFAGDVVAQGALVQPHLAAHESFPRGLKEMVAARFGTSTVVSGGIRSATADRNTALVCQPRTL